MKEQQYHPVLTSSWSRWVLVATIIRWMIILGMLPEDIKWRLSSSPWLQSTLVRPNNLFEHVTEATAVRQFVSTTFDFADAYRIQQHIQLPPLVLACLQELVELSSRQFSSERAISGFFLWGVDVGVAFLLYFIGRQLFQLERLDPWEETIHYKMHKSIQPLQSYFTVYAQARPESDNADENNTEATKDSTSDQEAEDATLTTPALTTPALLSREDLNTLLALLYYASPVSILCSSLYGSFQNVWILLLLSAISISCRPNGSISLAAFCLSMVTYAEVHYLVFVIPCAIWICKRHSNDRHCWGRMTQFLSFFIVWTTCLHVMSFLLVGKSYGSILAASYGLAWNRLSLNLGVLWYFQMQVFHRFRRYFVVLITGLPYLVVFPITIRLYRFPMVVVVLFWWLFTIFRPVPTLHDLNVGLCLMLLCPQSVVRMGKASLVSLCALGVPISLYMLDCWLWLETGTGNANYIFFQAMAYQVFVVVLFLDFAGSSLRRDKALRLTEGILKTSPTSETKEQ